MKIAVDHNEQVSRSSNLIIHGVSEESNEKTDEMCLHIIYEKVRVDISLNDISRSHRLGRPISKIAQETLNPITPVIVKFTNMRKRLEVFRPKRNLKGSNLPITENLTQKRYNLYKDAMAAKLGKHNVWTNAGRILTKSGNSIIVISSHEDLL